MSINLDGKSLYQPSYITERVPLFYGGKQEEYLEMAENAIASGVTLISEELKNKTDPAIIYHRVVQSLQDARHQIALRHQPEKAHLFGMRRDNPNTHQDSYVTACTGLYGQYEEYNEKYLDQLTKILHRIPHDLKTFQKTSITVSETVMGKKSSFEIELLDMSELTRRKFTEIPSEQELHQALGITDKSPVEITHDYNLMNRLKLEHKEIYDRININGMLGEINKSFPSPAMEGKVKSALRFERKNIYVLATLRLELEPKKTFCLARHLTWMYQNWQEDPIDRMKQHSVDYVIHQDPFLIERTQNACSQIFADILAWDRTESLEVLKDRVALLRFVYGNSMPCSRGDGSVGDWLELAIYRHHGFEKTKHNSSLLPCCELLSTISISNYLKNYRKTIVVE
ncbi:MAG TPA: hypothetical protein VHL30_00310 [Chlamydiales bacterium]|jgi:hypothetical protein|nr:hypothetical protein [Chlamydiales bacterium]